MVAPLARSIPRRRGSGDADRPPGSTAPAAAVSPKKPAAKKAKKAKKK
jgi:hypothetical protein